MTINPRACPAVGSSGCPSRLALVGNPKVAILDELSAGLDPQARRTTWEVVRRELDAGATVLLVTHFTEEAERLCDRLIIIDRGRVIAEGFSAGPHQLRRRCPKSRGRLRRHHPQAGFGRLVLTEGKVAERHHRGHAEPWSPRACRAPDRAAATLD